MMKRFVAAICLLAVAQIMTAQSMVVGSYNIRYKNSEDSIRGNLWSKRCQVICDQVNWEQPAVLGAQEVLHSQLQDLLRGLDGYDYIGVGRDDGHEAGEYAAIFYRKEQVEILDHGHFWLSETPERPALGWDAACIRICTWGHFRECSSGREFLFMNLHMDHVGVTARREAARLVVKRLAELRRKASGGNESVRPLPAILTGDFNVDQHDEIYTIFTESGLLKDSYETARLRFAENGTWNDFKSHRLTDSRIDHIFVSPSVQVDAYAVLTNSYWTVPEGSSHALLRHPSDHYPVFARLRF